MEEIFEDSEEKQQLKLLKDEGNRNLLDLDNF